MPGEVNRKKHEVIGLLLLMVAVLLLLCLVSYNPHDSSFNALSLKLSVDNKIGKLGAYVSDFLFQILGFSAFYLLLPLLILSWKLIFAVDSYSLSQDPGPFPVDSIHQRPSGAPPHQIGQRELHARRSHRCPDRRPPASESEPDRHRDCYCRVLGPGHFCVDNAHPGKLSQPACQKIRQPCTKPLATLSEVARKPETRSNCGQYRR
jgi:hypothetical protein